MKAREKPRMKGREWIIVSRRTRGPAWAAVSSSKETPVMKVMYEGTSGSTQGETKETSPAKNAARRDTSLTGHSNTGALRREERLNRLLEGLLLHASHEFLHDPPLPVQHEGRGNSDDAPEPARRVRVGEKHGIVHVELLGKGLHRGGSLRVEGESDHQEALVAVFRLEPHEVGHLGPARPAPGVPEVQAHDLAREIGQLGLLPRKVHQLEIRGLRSDLARVGWNGGAALFGRAPRAAEREEGRHDQGRGSPGWGRSSRGTGSIFSTRKWGFAAGSRPPPCAWF